MPILSKRQKNRVAKVIRAKRKELFGYSGGNRVLAERIGVSPQLVSMWACNKRAPRDRELLALAEAFGMSYDELCYDSVDFVRSSQAEGKRGAFTVTHSDAQNNMLEICDIAIQLVKCQKKMLRGKRDVAKHSDWLKRIKNYVDAL